jgi:hypothetical protein
LMRRTYSAFSFRLSLVGLVALAMLSPGLLSAGVYPRIDGSFAITNLAMDPFDYTLTDVRVQVQQPDSSIVSLPAFFDGGTTWRVRHMPTAPGLYQATGVTLNGQALAVSLQPGSWMVSGSAIGPGYVRVDPANANRFITSDGRRYFPVGEDVAWDVNSTASVVNLLAKLGGARENWARIWMDDWDGKNLDWPKPGPFGQLSLTVAQKWDAIVSAAEQSGVFFQMTLQHHGQYSSNVDPEWNNNPYNSANGGFMTNAAQFFTNATAKALTKRKLRYAVARWGYSPSIMAWELFNEVQFTDAAQGGQWSLVGAWHDEMATFIRSQDVYQHLITTSSDMSQPIWNQCDYYTHHDYPTELISALRDPPGAPLGRPPMPVFGAESGSDSTFYYGLHAPLWAGLMGAQSGGAQPWYWDRVDAEQGYNLIRPLRDFVLWAGIGEQDVLAKTNPHVTCAQGTSLVFSPGGGWSTASQSTFTVGEGAPTGIGSLPSFLQGNFHRSMTPNGFTFIVNYGSGGGTFSAQIVTIAASGAGLQMTVDNTTTNSISFPATGVDVNTNYTMTVNVGAGQHTVRLWNPGSDWVNLGNITLDPYVPMIGAYQIGNSNLAALWLWHRTNIYNSSASATLAATLPLGGLKPGNYLGTWWDTFGGMAISNFTFTVADTNPVTLATPAILRSVAFFAGAPPQSSVTPPQLTQTLGTNSLPLILPLVITNAGGLPLSYSLCVTGVSPIAYKAINSSQPGGPTFAWKDISMVGRDWTTNFTALTVKTAKDEGIAGPIDIGFSFPFFSGGQSPGLYTQLYVSPNGFVTFSPFAGDTSVNLPLPLGGAPTNLIAFFWDDLDLSTTGHVYTDNDPFAGTFTLQFQNVQFKGTASMVTCQLILKTSGEILMQYKSMATSNACTVGVQNGAGNQGLQVAYNQSYLQTNMCVRLTPSSWLTPAASAGFVPKTGAETNSLVLNPAGLAYGSYRATLLVETNNGVQPLAILPVALDVTPIGTWRQSNFGTAANSGNAADNADPDHDGLINIFEYAFNTNPNMANGSPVSYSIVGDHLRVNFNRMRPAPADITYLFEVATDLVNGPWQSGSPFTSQSVTDNGNGTETVMVTDAAAVSTSGAHYLRIRIGRN